MNKEKVITVYFDDYDRIDSEFSWLYKTWLLHSLDEEFDLMVYHEPRAKSRLEKYPGIVPIEMPAIGMSKENPFLKSTYIFNEPWCSHMRSYRYVFKTDCDVFLTQYLKGYTPFQTLLGKGSFYTLDEKNISSMKKIADKLGLQYQYWSNVGCSMFGETETIIAIFQYANAFAEKILKNKWYEPFSPNLTSMIAAELTVNAYLTNQHMILYALDYFCWKTTKINSDTMHIHAWHTTQKWSKHDFLNGLYKDWVIESYEQSQENAADYCHWVATTPLEKILQQREKLRVGGNPFNRLGTQRTYHH